MVDQKDLSLLQKDDKVDHFLLVRKCEQKTTRQNKPFLNLELSDRSATVNANFWDNFDSIVNNLQPGTVVKIKGVAEEYQGALQIKITSASLPKPSDNVTASDFLPRSSHDPVKMTNDFLDRIEAIKNSDLKSLLRLIFDKNNMRKFALAPAGKAWHHGYLHGLLEHTLEIIRICDLMCDIHPELNRDLLIAGAMLHDFGKTEELNRESSFDYTDKGKLIGHIVIAAMLINEKCRELPDFPEKLKMLLIHLILSHQGKLEHASPVVPKTLEAIALYQADELSAKVNAYKNSINTETRGEITWTKFIRLAETDLYNHGLSSDSGEIPRDSLFD